MRARITGSSAAPISVVAPIGITAVGKMAAAIRDLSPLAYFGVGPTLDSAVLAGMAGSLLGSMALATAPPLCIPLLARSDPRSRSVQRGFVFTAVAIGISAIFLQGPAFAVLGLPEAGTEAVVVYRCAIAAAACQALVGVLGAHLLATTQTFWSLSLPFFAGVSVPLFLAVRPTLASMGAGLVCGSMVDVVAAAILVRRHRTQRSPSHVASEGATKIRVEFLVLSQVVTLIVVFGERALMARGAAGVVGAVAIAARVSAAAATVVGGSIEPQIIRRVSAGEASRAIAGVTGRVSLIGMISTLAVVALLIAAVIAQSSILVTAIVLYSISLPSLIGYRVIRAVYFGNQSYGADLAMTIFGGCITIGVAAIALWSSVDRVFALAIPLSTGLVAVVAGIGLKHASERRTEVSS